MGSFNFLDILILICGAYLAYSGVQMKNSGEIKASVALSKNVTPDQIKDKAGYIEYIWKKLVLCGGLCVVAAVMNLIIARLEVASAYVVYINAGVNILFFVIIIVYGVLIAKAQKKFSGR